MVMRWWFFALMFLLAGCDRDAAINKLIPDSVVKNASHEGLEVINIDVQNGKMVKGGMLVTADVVVSSRIKPEEIGPTCLGVLRELSKRNRGCEWISIRMSDDKRMMETSHFFAMAELKEGKLSVTGGMPTEAEIAEYNKLPLDAGNMDWSKETRDFTLRRPTEEDIMISYQWGVSKLRLNRVQRSVSDSDIDAATSKLLNLNRDKVRESNRLVYFYYAYKIGNRII